MKAKRNFHPGTGILPVAFLALFFILSCSAGRKSTKTVINNPPAPGLEEPFVVVEEMPMYPGGDSTLLAYLVKNTKYPESAKKEKIQGKVIVRFAVNTQGGVDRVSVLRGVNSELDSEAVRVVSTLSGFKPGRQGGKAVPVWYMAPIDFSLK
jgi:protein TonB